VPAVVLEDGRPLAESGAILWHFADGTPYLPDDPYARAQVLQWMFFEQYNVGPGIAMVRYLATIAEEPPPAEQIEARRPTGRAALQTMERHLREREFFVGEGLTIADLALFAYTHIAPEGGFNLAPHPAVGQWLERVAAQPGFVPMGD
jgi:glutathione S-transferase